MISAGMFKFGKFDGLLAREIFAEAAKEAFSRCLKLDPKNDIKAVFIGHMGEAFDHQGHRCCFKPDTLSEHGAD